MRFRVFLGLTLGVLAAIIFVFRPQPFRILLDSLPGVGVALFYIALLGAAAALMVSTLPQARVDPSGKAVFITGCDSGFGNELARRLDKMGFAVFAGCLAPDREGARGLKSSTSDRLHVVKCDVTDDWQVRQANQFVRENLGDNELWAVVNNAGVATFCEIEWCSVEEFKKMMDVNVFGIVRVTKAFLPLLRASQGRVVNVASLAGRFTLPAFSAYSMSKKACIAFSDGLRQEMSKFKIKVITIEPGLYKTPISEGKYLIEKNRREWAGTPTDVREDYGEEYFDAFLAQIETNMNTARDNISEVLDDMEEAVCVFKPKIRYVPYWKIHMRATFIAIAPVWLTDWLFARRCHKVPPQSVRRSRSSSSSSSHSKTS